MIDFQDIRFFIKRNQLPCFVLGMIILVSFILASEHFLGTLKFCAEWVLSKLKGTPDFLSEPHLKLDALQFVAKFLSIFFLSLFGLTLFLIFGLPVVGYTQAIDNLQDQKSQLLEAVRGHTKTLEGYSSFASKADQHQRAQLALMQKYNDLVETLRLNILNTERSLADLNKEINQLRAISAALGKELEPDNKRDQGVF